MISCRPLIRCRTIPLRQCTTPHGQQCRRTWPEMTIRKVTPSSSTATRCPRNRATRRTTISPSPSLSRRTANRKCRTVVSHNSSSSSLLISRILLISRHLRHHQQLIKRHLNLPMPQSLSSSISHHHHHQKLPIIKNRKLKLINSISHRHHQRNPILPLLLIISSTRSSSRTLRRRRRPRRKT